jgi:hypothetical protein
MRYKNVLIRFQRDELKLALSSSFGLYKNESFQVLPIEYNLYVSVACMRHQL